MTEPARAFRWHDPIEASIVWLVGAVLIPLSLIAVVVVSKDASYGEAVAGGELFAIGTGIAGASLALELLLASSRLTITVYRSALLLILIANALMFAGTVEVVGDQLIRNLDDDKIAISVWLCGIAATLGIWAPVRKVIADSSLR